MPNLKDVLPTAMSDDAFRAMHNEIARASFISEFNAVLSRSADADRATLYLCLLEAYLLGRRRRTEAP
jgi:hypothetical protein